jgi:hypothetical protein
LPYVSGCVCVCERERDRERERERKQGGTEGRRDGGTERGSEMFVCLHLI